jgi:hypothetical protein
MGREMEYRPVAVVVNSRIKFDAVKPPLSFIGATRSLSDLSRNYAVEFWGSAAASAAVRRASRRTQAREKSPNGGFVSSARVSREGATHCARGGRAPHSNCIVTAKTI